MDYRGTQRKLSLIPKEDAPPLPPRYVNDPLIKNGPKINSVNDNPIPFVNRKNSKNLQDYPSLPITPPPRDVGTLRKNSSTKEPRRNFKISIPQDCPPPLPIVPPPQDFVTHRRNSDTHKTICHTRSKELDHSESSVCTNTSRVIPKQQCKSRQMTTKKIPITPRVLVEKQCKPMPKYNRKTSDPVMPSTRYNSRSESSETWAEQQCKPSPMFRRKTSEPSTRYISANAVKELRSYSEAEEKLRRDFGQVIASFPNSELQKETKKEMIPERKLMNELQLKISNRRETTGEVHIIILFAGDGTEWKNYLYELFTQMVPKEEGGQAVRVEVKNVEEIEKNLSGLEAIKLKEARLQIVIISPRFMSHIAAHGRSEIGQLFEPDKVLGLLLGVHDSQFSMAHLSALYSYKDWYRLKVRNSDLHFVEEVVSAAIKILNSNKLYSDCLDERAAKFRITSRKVTMAQKQVYILLNEEVLNSDNIEVLIEAPSRSTTPIHKYHLLNPFTIWFTMPEEFLKTSSLLKISVMINGDDMGCRQLKCESHMDTLRDILAIVSNPTELMCQALNINPICDDLDQKLAEKVKYRLPLTKMEDPQSNRTCAEFPTWIHFSAYYGLERLTWTLLEIPGSEEALNIPNCNGQTPSVLAYQKGFYSLAQKLEDATLLSSLAIKLRNIPKAQGNCEPMGEYIGVAEEYNSPPPPRPIGPKSNSLTVRNYDSLPAPRIVDSNGSSPSGVTPPDSINNSPVPNFSSDEIHNDADNAELAPGLSTLENEGSHPLTPVSIRYKTKINSEIQADSYLDMSPIDRQNNVNDYHKEVYTLIEAWNEKTNIQAFVEKNQSEIDKMKNKLEDTQQEFFNNDIDSKSDLGASLPEVPDGSDRISNDLSQQKTMVDKLITLLQDPSSITEEKPNSCYKDEVDTGVCVISHENTSPPVCGISSQNTPSSPPPSPSYQECTNHSTETPIADYCHKPPVPPPRPESEDNYLSYNEVHSPKQFEIALEMKKIEEENLKKMNPPKLQKDQKGSSSDMKKRNYLPSSITRKLSGAKRKEQKDEEEDVLYTTLLNK